MVNRSLALALMAFAALTVAVAQVPQVSSLDPIAYIGHGAAFTKDGREINITPQFIEEAQAYYTAVLAKSASPERRAALDKQRARMWSGGTKLQGQSAMVANALLIDTLLADSKLPNAGEIAGKNNFLKSVLRTRMSPINQPFGVERREAFAPPAALTQLLTREGLRDQPIVNATTPGATQYIQQCAAEGVPIPPDWGGAQWVSKGVFDKEFISEALDTEVFVYDSTSPLGVCFALPRSVGETIELLGIICLGEMSSKACFWDNQQNKKNFPIPKGKAVALTEFAGGGDLVGGAGGICTSCHLGENPFILHPKTSLGLPILFGLKLRSDSWYKPMVDASWPQNEGPSDILDNIPSPGACTECHHKTGSGGRFPHIVPELGYCGSVLRQAIEKTMPPGKPNDPDYAAHINALRAACGTT